MKKTQRNLALVSVILFYSSFIPIFFCHWIITRYAEGKTFEETSQIPYNKVGLILGCVRYTADGKENHFFRKRIQAAFDLYQSGKIDYILVSGDNHRKGYNEPADMKQALIELGIPAQKIYCDYAGFRTLDSVIRAKEVFQSNPLTIVSQKFHNERAIYIAKENGITAVGYNADDVSFGRGLKTYIREGIARVMAVLDVKLLQTRPKFLGDPIPIPQEI